jgi:hypothetical protein
MNRERFVSLREIINRVHMLGKDVTIDVTEDDVITYVIELIDIVGMPQLFLNKVETLEIHKNRAELPCDFVEEQAVKCCNNISFNASTDMFSVEESRTHVPTYKIQGDFIVTSIEEGYIKLAYRAIKTDEYGYPMIIDDQAFIRALVDYIVYNAVFGDYLSGRFPEDKMERLEKKYETDIAIATSKLTQPTQDEFDNIARMMNSFIFRHNAKKTGFKNLGDEMPKRPLHSNTVHFDFINPLH